MLWVYGLAGLLILLALYAIGRSIRAVHEELKGMHEELRVARSDRRKEGGSDYSDQLHSMQADIAAIRERLAPERDWTQPP